MKPFSENPTVAGLLFQNINPFYAVLIFGFSNLVWWSFMFMSIWFRLSWADQQGSGCEEGLLSACTNSPKFPFSLDMMPDKIFFWGGTAIWALNLGFFLISFIPTAVTRFTFWLIALCGTIIGPLSGFWVVLIWYVNDYSTVTEFTGAYTVAKIFIHLFLLALWFLFMTIFNSELLDPIWMYYWTLADRA